MDINCSNLVYIFIRLVSNFSECGASQGILYEVVCAGSATVSSFLPHLMNTANFARFGWILLFRPHNCLQLMLLHDLQQFSWVLW